jgi:septum formation protein
MRFKIIPPGVSENSSERRPRRLVQKLALRKARAIASRHPGAWVLGADTVVACQGRILFKPKNRRDCARILRSLNGRWHRVYTGVALVHARTGKAWERVAISKVKARRLAPKELNRLIGKHMDKSGAYAVQDRQDLFIERIQGPLDNVIGLPLSIVRKLLKRTGSRS